MFRVYATLPVPSPISEMEELLVSSEEFYREVGEQERYEVDTQSPERACVEIDM